MTLYAFDGTWNSDEVDDIQDTNVVRFKELYMGNNTEYLEGVGTRFGKVGELLGGLFGLLAGMGVLLRLKTTQVRTARKIKRFEQEISKYQAET